MPSEYKMLGKYGTRRLDDDIRAMLCLIVRNLYHYFHLESGVALRNVLAEFLISKG